jgi:hypothetical protein
MKPVLMLSLDLPSPRIAVGLGKAALKTHALQTLRDRRASPNRAKRLECVRIIGAFRPAWTARGSWSQCTAFKFWGLSINLPSPRIAACGTSSSARGRAKPQSRWLRSPFASSESIQRIARQSFCV